jgi:cyanophycinase
MPAPVLAGQQRGLVIPIGGAEDKINNTEILSRFVEVCGDKPVIGIIPTASSLPDTGSSYQVLFEKLGAAEAHVLEIGSRSDCASRDVLSLLDSVDGVFITGGNQLKLSTTIGGTPVAQSLRRRNASGMPIAGTSAGAAIMPEHMIAGGEPGATPQADMATLAPGLGLSNKVMIDQHFRQRDRIGRLLAALAYNPFPVGLGIDEDTAAFIDGNDCIEVVGSGAITIVDPSHLKHSSVHGDRMGDPVTMIDLRLHVLASGCHYDIGSRMAAAPGAPCEPISLGD